MFQYIFLPANIPVSVPAEMTKFKCLILIEREVEDLYRNALSKTLVQAGCLYALAWGRDCSLWDDSVDWAFLEQYDYGEYPKDKFVMTTWHDDETLEDTLEFAKHTAIHPDVQLEDLLVLDLSPKERRDHIETLYQSI